MAYGVKSLYNTPPNVAQCPFPLQLPLIMRDYNAQAAWQVNKNLDLSLRTPLLHSAMDWPKMSDRRH